MPTNDFGVKVAIHRNSKDPSSICYSLWGELIPEEIRYEFVAMDNVQSLSDRELAILLLKNYFK